MKLTVEQRKRLAEEARKLAEQYAEGRGPQPMRFLRSRSGHPGEHCAIGWVEARAKVEMWDPLSRAQPPWMPAAHIVAEASDLGWEDRRPACVFPLLALADALDASVP